MPVPRQQIARAIRVPEGQEGPDRRRHRERVGQRIHEARGGMPRTPLPLGTRLPDLRGQGPGDRTAEQDASEERPADPRAGGQPRLLIMLRTRWNSAREVGVSRNRPKPVSSTKSRTSRSPR